MMLRVRRGTSDTEYRLWLRAREASISRAYLFGAATLFFLLSPLSFLQIGLGLRRFENMAGVGAAGALVAVLAALILIVLAACANKSWFIRRPVVELGAWVLFIIFVGMFGAIPAMTDLAMDTMQGQPHSPAMRLTIAASSATMNALAILVASLAMLGAPRLFWLLILFSLLTLVGHDSLWRPEAFWSALLVPISHGFALLVHGLRDRSYRATYRTEMELRAADARQRELLSSLLPPSVQERLGREDRVADAYADLTVAFIDLAGFTSLARRIAPGQLVEILNRFFGAADAAALQAGVEKVKTIGDCYMAVAGGVASPRSGPAEMIGFVERVVATVHSLAAETGLPFAARAGVHVGPAVGGVIGRTRPAYDYWGETINLASRLEAMAPQGGVAVSEAVRFQLRNELAGAQRVEAELKGVGATAIFTLAFVSSGSLAPPDTSPALPPPA